MDSFGWDLIVLVVSIILLVCIVCKVPKAAPYPRNPHALKALGAAAWKRRPYTLPVHTIAQQPFLSWQPTGRKREEMQTEEQRMAILALVKLLEEQTFLQ